MARWRARRRRVRTPTRTTETIRRTPMRIVIANTVT
ncbi:Uncharacterised protein [Mycobacteroides abscessus subsp. abscessus]|nr:Uncharacterised protein [Mycobacteroides abscessus subsp. abscessus]